MTLRNRDEILAAGNETLLAECELDFFKATGKGGQKRNKTSSAVRLTHRPTGIQVTDCSERSQHRNRGIALGKLKMEIALNCRNFPAEPPEDPERRDPATAARLFDVLEEADYDLAEAAARLGVSNSKLLKILNREPIFFARFNQRRIERGKAVLHA